MGEGVGKGKGMGDRNLPRHASAARSEQRQVFDRSWQRRMIWLVMAPSILLLGLGGWVERAWWPRGETDRAVPVDTLLPQPEPAVADAVIIPGAPAAAGEATEPLGATAAALAMVRDDTVFCASDRQAWFEIWAALQASAHGIDQPHSRQVSFAQLFGQPRSYRGRLVHLSGTIRRLQRVEAPPNAQGISSYWQAWIEPDGGPAAPIVLYFLSVPAEMPHGMRVSEAVDVTGYFFKRWAYQASDAVRIAPLVMAREPHWRRRTGGASGSHAAGGGALVAMAALGVVVLLFLRWGGGPKRPRSSRGSREFTGIPFDPEALVPEPLDPEGSLPPSAPVVRRRGTGPSTSGASSGAWILVWCLCPLVPGAVAEEIGGGSLETYLATFRLDRSEREIGGTSGGWDDARQEMALRLLTRLQLAPADRWADWSAAAVAGWAVAESASDSASGGDRLMRVTGRAVFLAAQPLSPSQADRFGCSSINLVRIQCEDGTPVDILAAQVPRAWPRWHNFDEPASVVGLQLTAAAGPFPTPAEHLLEATSAVSAGEKGVPLPLAPWPAEPAAGMLVAPRVAWHPSTPLGKLGMDYGLLDAVVDGGKIGPQDAPAFYAMIAAAGRTSAGELAAMAGPPLDPIPLIDPSQNWFATHRGEPLTIEGVALRATRIEIDDELQRRATGIDHYWELFVFVPTPLIKVGGRLQETYPLVCCVQNLPAGMPVGASIHEPLRVSGFAFKRYGYPLPQTASEPADRPQRQEVPLLIGPAAVRLPPSGAPAAVTGLGWVASALVGVGVVGLAGAVWKHRRNARRAEGERRAALPERFALPAPQRRR